MKGFTEEIHDRILNLPLLFILALFRLVEKEYTKEDFEKTPADPQLGDTFSLVPWYPWEAGKFQEAVGS